MSKFYTLEVALSDEHLQPGASVGDYAYQLARKLAIYQIEPDSKIELTFPVVNKAHAEALAALLVFSNQMERIRASNSAFSPMPDLLQQHAFHFEEGNPPKARINIDLNYIKADPKRAPLMQGNEKCVRLAIQCLDAGLNTLIIDPEHCGKDLSVLKMHEAEICRNIKPDESITLRCHPTEKGYHQVVGALLKRIAMYHNPQIRPFTPLTESLEMEPDTGFQRFVDEKVASLMGQRHFSVSGPRQHHTRVGRLTEHSSSSNGHRSKTADIIGHEKPQVRFKPVDAAAEEIRRLRKSGSWQGSLVGHAAYELCGALDPAIGWQQELGERLLDKRVLLPLGKALVPAGTNGAHHAPLMVESERRASRNAAWLEQNPQAKEFLAEHGKENPGIAVLLRAACERSQHEALGVASMIQQQCLGSPETLGTEENPIPPFDPELVQASDATGYVAQHFNSGVIRA